jgi:hypothetical protein
VEIAPPYGPAPTCRITYAGIAEACWARGIEDEIEGHPIHLSFQVKIGLIDRSMTRLLLERSARVGQPPGEAPIDRPSRTSRRKAASIRGSGLMARIDAANAMLRDETEFVLA